MHLGRSVEFGDSRNVEPLLKLVPYVGTKTVAVRRVYSVFLVVLARLLAQQVPTELADVLNDGRIVLPYFGEEFGSAKLARKSDG